MITSELSPSEVARHLMDNSPTVWAAAHRPARISQMEFVAETTPRHPGVILRRWVVLDGRKIEVDRTGGVMRLRGGKSQEPICDDEGTLAVNIQDHDI